MEAKKKYRKRRKPIIVKPNTPLYRIITEYAKDQDYMKGQKLSLLDALQELNYLDDGSSPKTRLVLFNYKYLLDGIEETVKNSIKPIQP